MRTQTLAELRQILLDAKQAYADHPSEQNKAAKHAAAQTLNEARELDRTERV